MLRLLQILYLELLLVEVSVSFLEFLGDLLPLLLEHVDLFDLLLKLRLDDALLILGLLHLVPRLFFLELNLFLLALDLLLLLLILLVLFNELVPLLSVFLLDLDDLLLVVVLHPIQLLVVDLLEHLAGALAVDVLALDLDHVRLELSQQLVYRPLVLPLQILNARLVVLTHLQLVLLQLQVIPAFHVQLTLVDRFQILNCCDVVFFHFVHRLLVLVILQFLLFPEVFIPFLKVFNIQILLSLNLLVLPLVLLLGLPELLLDLALVLAELHLQRLLLAPPLLHLLLPHQHDIRQRLVYNLRAAAI